MRTTNHLVSLNLDCLLIFTGLRALVVLEHAQGASATQYDGLHAQMQPGHANALHICFYGYYCFLCEFIRDRVAFCVAESCRDQPVQMLLLAGRSHVPAMLKLVCNGYSQL
jgi:hypothetical protein